MGIYTLAFLDSCLSRYADKRRIRHPIDCIADHHLVEREVCALLDRLADPNGKAVSRADLAEVIDFLTTELPLHLTDEAEDLFPRMRARCEPEDEIDRAIDRLQAEHAHAGKETEGVLAVLRVLQSGTVEIDGEMRRALSEFAAHARRHLIFENAIILPIARARLTDQDLADMRLAMTRRREAAGIGD